MTRIAPRLLIALFAFIHGGLSTAGMALHALPGFDHCSSCPHDGATSEEQDGATVQPDERCVLCDQQTQPCAPAPVGEAPPPHWVTPPPEPEIPPVLPPRFVAPSHPRAPPALG